MKKLRSLMTVLLLAFQIASASASEAETESRAEPEWIVIVHGLSTGATFAPTFRAKAKELGIEIKIAHVRFGEFPKSLASTFVPSDYDKTFEFGLTDHYRAVQALRSLDLKYSVVAGADSSYPHVDILNDRLGLPGNDVSKALQRTNKEHFYKELKLAGLMPAPFASVSGVEEGLKAARDQDFKYPFILKPVDDAAGNGFTVVNNVKELRGGLTRLFSSKTKTVRGTPVGSVLLQPRLKGPEFAIQGAIREGVVVVTDVIDLKKDNAIYDLDKLVDPRNALLRRRIEHVKAALRATGLKEGTFHYETILDQDYGMVTFDPGARPMGGPDHFMVKECTGYNQVDALVEAMLDPEAFFERAAEAERTGIPYKKFHAGRVVEIRYPTSGRLTADANIALLQTLPSFRLARLAGKKGDRVVRTTNLLDTAGTVVLVGTEEQVEADYHTIRTYESKGLIIPVKSSYSICGWIADHQGLRLKRWFFGP